MIYLFLMFAAGVGAGWYLRHYFVWRRQKAMKIALESMHKGMMESLLRTATPAMMYDPAQMPTLSKDADGYVVINGQRYSPDGSRLIDKGDWPEVIE